MKETIDIDIYATSRNGDRKIIQSIRVTSRPPSRIRKWNYLSWFRWTSTKVIPIEDLSWLYFDNESRVQGKDQQSCISVFGVCPTTPSGKLGAPIASNQTQKCQHKHVPLTFLWWRQHICILHFQPYNFHSLENCFCLFNYMLLWVFCLFRWLVC